MEKAYVLHGYECNPGADSGRNIAKIGVSYSLHRRSLVKGNAVL